MTTCCSNEDRYKRRIEAITKKTDVAIDLIKKALSMGIEAGYVLMDSWFTHESLIKSCLDEGIDVIGMVKLVYVKNRNKKRSWLVILSTDCSLSNEEIVLSNQQNLY
jgi:3-isopropylmalate dehydratase small subunit